LIWRERASRRCVALFERWTHSDFIGAWKNLQRARLRSPRLAWREQVAAVRGDLDCIVMKCLEKDRTRRYETANGLATDLQRHMDDEPVVARPPSVRYRFFKAWQRHKLAFAAAGAVVATLLLGIAMTSWQAVEANRARGAEKAQRLRADAEKADARRLLYGADMSLAQQAWEQNNIGRVQQLLKETEQWPNRGFEWYYWQRQLHLPLKTFRHSGPVTAAAFSPDGARFVTTSEDGVAQVWETTSGRKLATFQGYGGLIYSAAFSPDGRWIANGVRLRRPPSGKRPLAGCCLPSRDTRVRFGPWPSHPMAAGL